jgi:hypothetical protein
MISETPQESQFFQLASPGGFILLLSAILLAAIISLTNNSAHASQVTFAWDPVVDSRLLGYKIYYGTQTKVYSAVVDAGNVTTAPVTGLQEGVTYYFAATAYGEAVPESDFSNEVSYKIPSAAPCTYSLAPTSRAFTSVGGKGTTAVTTQPSCAWTSGGTSWMSITGGSSGTGNGTVSYMVSPNTAGSTRTAAITIGGQLFTVTQTGGYTITASAGTGGTISPSGSVSVTSGSKKSFSIAASSGYTISNVAVDGSSVGAVSSYTFTNVTGNHAISATFRARSRGGR